MSDESREYTADEVRDFFLGHVKRLISYWNNQQSKTPREMLEGLAFSMLVMLDGGAGGLPSFIVAPNPHPEDKEFHKSEGRSWWPENHHLDDAINADISGGLHELLHSSPGSQAAQEEIEVDVRRDCEKPCGVVPGCVSPCCRYLGHKTLSADNPAWPHACLEHLSVPFVPGADS